MLCKGQTSFIFYSLLLVYKNMTHILKRCDWLLNLYLAHKMRHKERTNCPRKKMPKKKTPEKKFFTLHIKCTTKGRQTAIIAAHLHLKHMVQSGFNFDTLFFFIRQAHYFSANYWFLVFQNDSSPVRQESPKNLLQDRWLPRLPLDQCTFDLFFFLEFSTAETRQ